MQQIFLAILGTFFACCVMAGMGFGGYLFYQGRKKATEAQERFCNAVDSLTGVAKDLADIPKLISGHGLAAQAFSIEISKLRESIDKFTGLIAKPAENGSGVDYTKEEDAELAWTVREVLIEEPGLSMDRAKEIAEDRLAKKAALPHLGME